MSTPEEHKRGIKEEYRCAVLSISTSRFREMRKGEEIKDRSGEIIKRMLRENKHDVIDYEILPDDVSAIKEKVSKLVNGDADVIITTGGTGLTSKDVTIEAISPMIEKEIPGFGELFRYRSFEQVGSAAVLTRALSGVINRRLVFSLPGSPNAVELALKEIIIPEIPHIMRHLGE
ncbi:MAG: MogA/MoaB family molybdenum cofactor biosynthesis protein [Halobacteriota archaeon]|nr:MogA/MoaB family molybdenum cofactor biosynthesis protein [Halobacteriota archaeon]